MKYLLLIGTLLALCLPVSAQTPTPQPLAYDNPNSPVDLLASYYNAINRGEYQRAYNYWENAPTDSYSSFANGFADTLSAQLIVQPPTFIDAGAGNLHVAIPVVLLAQHTDGTQHMYAGCIVTHKSNLHPPDIPQEDVWHLSSADIFEVALTASIPSLLANGCNATLNGTAS